MLDEPPRKRLYSKTFRLWHIGKGEQAVIAQARSSCLLRFAEQQTVYVVNYGTTRVKPSKLVRWGNGSLHARVEPSTLRAIAGREKR